MKKLLFFLLYLITICGGAYLGVCVFDVYIKMLDNIYRKKKGG